jgi:hypothetical protein
MHHPGQCKPAVGIRKGTILSTSQKCRRCNEYALCILVMENVLLDLNFPSFQNTTLPSSGI